MELSIAEATTPQCHLLNLPQELRDHIFTFALHSSEPIRLCDGRRFGRERRFFVKQPALTRANHQIRAEALPLFLSMNAFEQYLSLDHCADGPDLPSFLAAIGAENFTHVYDFVFTPNHSPLAEDSVILGSFELLLHDTRWLALNEVDKAQQERHSLLDSSAISVRHFELAELSQKLGVLARSSHPRFVWSSRVLYTEIRAKRHGARVWKLQGSLHWLNEEE